MLYRCTAHSSDLDAPAFPRSQEWTDLMVENLEKPELWDECGINPDIVVSYFVINVDAQPPLTIIFSHLHTISRTPIYMSSSRVTFCIKSLKEHSRTISLPGLASTLRDSMENQRPPKSWLILITGM